MKDHTQKSDHSNELSNTQNKIRTQNPPSLSKTGIGYHYVRCRAGGSDDTCYLHQLAAIAGGADPHDVFSDAFDVHHLPLDHWLDLDERVPATPYDLADSIIPALDVPHGVDVQPRWEHRSRNLESVDSSAEGGRA